MKWIYRITWALILQKGTSRGLNVKIISFRWQTEKGDQLQSEM